MLKNYTSSYVDICQQIGWDVYTPNNWQNLELWVKAALKRAHSKEYQRILWTDLIIKSSLDDFLFNKLLPLINAAQAAMSTNYGCARAYCSFEELLEMQWSESKITRDPLGHFSTCDGIIPSDSLQSWYPDHYLSKVEWFAHTHEPNTLFSEFFTYDTLFNPNIIREFMNLFHLGKNAPIPIDDEAFAIWYNYLLDVIPGFGYFGTHT
jgi:hypothetical protein